MSKIALVMIGTEPQYRFDVIEMKRYEGFAVGLSYPAPYISSIFAIKIAYIILSTCVNAPEISILKEN